MRYRELRRRCDRTVRDMISAGDLPDPFTLKELLDRLAARRGRAVALHPSDYVPGGVCGMWLKLPDIDIIVYARTVPLHEEHIVLHEIAHMICDHTGRSGNSEDLMRMLMPDLDPAMVRGLLGRSSYTDAEEQEAELIATLILERVADRRPGSARPVNTALAPELDRLRSTFSG